MCGCVVCLIVFVCSLTHVSTSALTPVYLRPKLLVNPHDGTPLYLINGAGEHCMHTYTHTSTFILTYILVHTCMHGHACTDVYTRHPRTFAPTLIFRPFTLFLPFFFYLPSCARARARVCVCVCAGLCVCVCVRDFVCLLVFSYIHVKYVRACVHCVCAHAVRTGVFVVMCDYHQGAIVCGITASLCSVR
jgi:hypothetical protein